MNDSVNKKLNAEIERLAQENGVTKAEILGYAKNLLEYHSNIKEAKTIDDKDL